EAVDPGRGPRQLIPGESRGMNLNNDIAVVRAREVGERRPLRLRPLHQLHPGRSPSLIRHHNRLHRSPPRVGFKAPEPRRDLLCDVYETHVAFHLKRSFSVLVVGWEWTNPMLTNSCN